MNKSVYKHLIKKENKEGKMKRIKKKLRKFIHMLICRSFVSNTHFYFVILFPNYKRPWRNISKETLNL